jgi:hypothetical protein
MPEHALSDMWFDFQSCQARPTGAPQVVQSESAHPNLPESCTCEPEVLSARMMRDVRHATFSSISMML